MNVRADTHIRLFAFDLGDVMIDVDESIPIARFAEMSGRSAEEVFAAIFSPDRKHPVETGAISPDEHARRACETLGLDLTSDEFWQIHCTPHTPNLHVGEIVVATAEKARVTIASNLPLPHWTWALANLPFAKSFQPPILSFDLGVMKPDLNYYRALIGRSGYDPAEIIFTDDRTENVAAASSLGMRAFHFRGAERLRSDLQSCGINL